MLMQWGVVSLEKFCHRSDQWMSHFVTIANNILLLRLSCFIYLNQETGLIKEFLYENEKSWWIKELQTAGVMILITVDDNVFKNYKCLCFSEFWIVIAKMLPSRSVVWDYKAKQQWPHVALRYQPCSQKRVVGTLAIGSQMEGVPWVTVYQPTSQLTLILKNKTKKNTKILI